jgi:hypothetical protein
MWRRRGGKALRACLGLVTDPRYSDVGRLVLPQEHPWECSTNYVAIACMRCNVDMQDLRRLLPPSLFMPPAELEPNVGVDEAQLGRGGGTVYPQRLRAFSLGLRPDWGWMQTFGTAPEADAISHLATDWHGIFLQILGDALPQPAEKSAASSPETQDMIGGLVVHSALLFADAHNAGFYINSHTT